MKSKIFKAVGAAILAAVVSLSSLTGAFAASNGNMSGEKGVSQGYRGADDESGFTRKQGYNFNYGPGLNAHTTAGNPVLRYYFSQSKDNWKSGKNLAYCLEPGKDISYKEYKEVTSPYYTGDSVNGVDSYARLSPNTKVALNYILANGYGSRNLMSAEKYSSAYYFAEQLLIWETVTGIRNPKDFTPAANRPHEPLTPTKYYEGEMKCKDENGKPTMMTVEHIQNAYDRMVEWVSQSLKYPSGTYGYSEYSTKPSKSMKFNPSTGLYEYTYTDSSGIIVRNRYPANGNGAAEKALNTIDSDIKVNNKNGSQVQWTWVGNNSIKFTSPKPLSEPISVEFTNSNTRGLQELVNKSNGIGPLILSKTGYVGLEDQFQCFARGASLEPRRTYFQLETASNPIKLEIEKSSSNCALSDNNRMYSLEGAVYGVYGDEACTEFLFDMTTNANGIAKSSQTVEGYRTYYAKEIKAPENFELDPRVIPFEPANRTENRIPVYEAKSTEVPLDDPAYIFLVKKPSVDNFQYDPNDLVGAQYKMEYYDGYYTEDELNAAINNGLQPVRSWVFETKYNGMDVTCEYRESFKVSGDKLYIGRFNTPALPYGTIRVYEVAPPPSGKFLLSSEKYVCIINKDSFAEVQDGNPPSDVLVSLETPTLSGLNIIKKSDDNIIKNIYFKVVGPSGTKIVSTGENGTAFLENLIPGKYTVTELGVKNGNNYVLPKRYAYATTALTQDVTLVADQPTTVSFNNRTSKGEINIEKVAEDDYHNDPKLDAEERLNQPNRVKGIAFRVTGTDGTNKVGYTDKDGKLSFKDLPVYDTNNNLITYTVEELGYPDGHGGYTFPIKYYKPANQTVRFDVVNSVNLTHQSKTVVFHNNLKKGKVVLHKSSNDGQIAGLEFELLADGINVNEAEFSPYYTSASFKPQYTTKKNNISGALLFFTDENGNLEIDDLPIYNDAGMAIVYTFSENFCVWMKNENSYSRELILGKYKLNRDEMRKSFTLTEGNIDVPLEVSVTNERPVIKLRIVKNSADAQIQHIWFNVKGIGYDVFDHPKTYIDQNFETDANGIIEVNDLWATGEEGSSGVTYTITELGLKNGNSFYFPERYIPQEPETIDSKDVRSYQPGEVGVYTYNCFNELKKGGIRIIKEAEDGKIKDIYFEVKNSSGKKYGPLSTDENGKIEFIDLPVYKNDGSKETYTVHELGEKQPDGSYKISDRYHAPADKTAELKWAENQPQQFSEVTITNTLKYGSLVIKKTDGYGKALDGVTIAIRDKNGNNVQPPKKTVNGTIKYENLLPGTYYLVETRTASGYSLLKDKVEVVVEPDKETTTDLPTVEIKNYEIPVLKVGGSNAGMIFACVAGGVLLAGTAAMLFFKRKKRSYSGNNGGTKTMKSIATKILSLTLTVMMVMSMLCAGLVANAAAADNASDKAATNAAYHIDMNKKGSITIHKYEVPDIDVASASGTGEASDVDKVPEEAKPLADVTFTIYKFAELDEYFTATEAKMPTVSDVKLPVNAAKAITVTTDENGIAVAKDLPLGFYYVEETDGPAQITKKAEPFVISLPFTNKEGTEWLYDLETFPKNQTGYGDTSVKKIDSESELALEGAQFKLESYGKDNKKLVKELDPNLLTGENGIFTVTSLPSNTYYRYSEVKASDESYILDNSVYYEFYIDGTGDMITDWTDIDENNMPVNGKAVPENILIVKNEKPQIHKYILDGEKGLEGIDNTASVGDTVYWKIRTTVPSEDLTKKMTTYAVTDTMSKGIKYKSAEVYLDDKTKLEEGEGKDYTVEILDDLNVRFNFDTAKIAGAEEVIIYYNTILTEEAPLAVDIPNTSKLTYTNDINAQTTWDLMSEVPTVHTGGYLFVKTNKDEPLEGAKFEIYATEEDAKARKNGLKTAVSGSDGIVKFMGLAYGSFSADEEGKKVNGVENGSRDYWIVELEAPKGYSAMSGVAKVTINSKSHIPGNTKDIINYLVPEQPKTGGILTVGFIAMMVGAFAMGAGLFIVIRRKSRKG